MSTASNQQSGISIGSLARRTGVPVDTLRAWERRYGVLRPERTDGGQRRYGDRDVERVLWLSARVAEGQRISDAVAALNALEREDDEADARGGPTAALASRLNIAARQGDGARVELELDRAFAALPMVQAMELVVFPALADLGLEPAAVGLGAAWSGVADFAARPPKAAGTVVSDDGQGGVQIAEFLTEQKFI